MDGNVMQREGREGMVPSQAYPQTEAAPSYIREMRISPCLNGYIVAVGCQHVVFVKGDEALMASEVAAYLTNPAATEARYLNPPQA